MHNKYIIFKQTLYQLKKIHFYKKVPKILILITINILINIFIRVIYPLKKFKTYQLEASTFGHFYMDLLLIRYFKIRNPKIIILISIVGLDKFYNKFIKELACREFIYSPFFKYIDMINSFMPFSKIFKVYDFRRSSSSKDIFGLFYYKKKKNNIFTNQENNKCESIAKELGIYQKKIITLNIRDNYLYNKILNIDDDSDSLRNQVNMNILHKSIDMLIRNNFTIVRVGRYKNKLPINLKNKVVDLPNIGNIPDIFDIWIFKNIHLHIGDCSGPDGLPTYFDKPSLILNTIFPQEGLEWAQGFSHPADLKWSNGKLLTLWDLLNLNLTNKNNIFFERKNLLEFGIEYVPLNENNILESVTEALKLLFYKNTIQEQYWKTCKIWDKIYSKDFPKNKKHYKRSFVFKHPKFLLSKSYLKNKSFDWFIPYKSSKS